MLCNNLACTCGIISDSLTVSGSGAVGDPFQIESNAYAIVATTGDLPAGFVGQHAYVIATDRDYKYDGTNWVIVGGTMPRFSIEAQTAQSIATTATATPSLSTEIFDTDGFHASTNGFVTIPSGLGGDYLILAMARWAANATGYRLTFTQEANNTGVASQLDAAAGGNQMENTVNNGHTISNIVRLRAAATVTLNVVQTSGGDLDLNQAFLKGFLLTHIPSLV